MSLTTLSRKFPRTWEEQKTYERNVRKRWLEELVSMGVTQAEAARYAGIDRGFLLRMCDKYDVHLPNRMDVQKIKAKRAMQARKAEAARKLRMEELAREVQERKSALIGEGFTEQQALRVVAQQMGVSL